MSQRANPDAFAYIRGHMPTRASGAAWYEGRITPFVELVAVRYSSDKRQGMALYHHEFSPGIYLGRADKRGAFWAPRVCGELVTLGNLSHFVVRIDGEQKILVAPAMMIAADSFRLQDGGSPVILVSPPDTAPRVAIVHCLDDPQRLRPRIEDRGIVQ